MKLYQYIILLWAVLAIVLPVILIWALNVLFKTNLDYTLYNWFAALCILLILKTQVDFGSVK
jgi:hypothetical protein